MNFSRYRVANPVVTSFRPLPRNQLYVDDFQLQIHLNGPFLQAKEVVDCRVDHYQTLDKVHVSIFAKQAEKERSMIQFDESQVFCDALLYWTLNEKTPTQIHIDLNLPGSKRFSRVLDLFGPIDPAESTSQFYATKVSAHGYVFKTH